MERVMFTYTVYVRTYYVSIPGFEGYEAVGGLVAGG